MLDPSSVYSTIHSKSLSTILDVRHELSIRLFCILSTTLKLGRRSLIVGLTAIVPISFTDTESQSQSHRGRDRDRVGHSTLNIDIVASNSRFKAIEKFPNVRQFCHTMMASKVIPVHSPTERFERYQASWLKPVRPPKLASSFVGCSSLRRSQAEIVDSFASSIQEFAMQYCRYLHITSVSSTRHSFVRPPLLSTFPNLFNLTIAALFPTSMSMEFGSIETLDSNANFDLLILRTKTCVH